MTASVGSVNLESYIIHKMHGVNELLTGIYDRNFSEIGDVNFLKARIFLITDWREELCGSSFYLLLTSSSLWMSLPSMRPRVNKISFLVIAKSFHLWSY